VQQSLFGRSKPEFDADFSEMRRHDLKHGAWVERQAGWLCGHESVFEALLKYADWRASQREMYDRIVEVPRLLAPEPTDSLCGPLCQRIKRALSERYQSAILDVSVAHYRNGNDSVAWHGDTIGRDRAQALVATVSLGAPRKFLVREKDGDMALSFQLGWGDLLVMGGTSQKTYEHSVPKTKYAGPRMALMFRSDHEPPQYALNDPPARR